MLTGALNLYAGPAAAFTEADVHQSAVRVADSAGADSVPSLSCSRPQPADGLQAAMQSREATEQVKGILTERRKASADVAFELLRTASQHTHRKLRDVANHLVATGELPVD